MPERAGATRRLFFALWPDAAVADALHALSGAAHAACGGRRMRLDTLHATLAFLGDVPADRRAAAIRAADSVRAEACGMVIDRLGCWRHNRILWAGCAATPAPVGALADALGAALRGEGFRLDERPFALHVTLLRNADCAAASGLPAVASPILWRADAFVLVESLLSERGARYAVLRRWPLATAIG